MRRLAVLDLETDPFAYGELPQPFVSGFYDGENFESIWSPDCVERLCKRLSKYKEPLIIYAHNGGKFDFFYFLKYLKSDLRIINGRIIQARLGEHELRDSFAIMPFPLRDFDKDDIDYQLMRADVREQHRAEIVKYLQKDCTSLHTLVQAFYDEFGDRLTIGGASLKELKKKHTFKCGGPKFDERFRKDFYFGGRNQVLRPGIINQRCRIYDVNSMYPYVMSAYLHPVGTASELSKRIRRNTCFVVAEGKNYGAFPVRAKNGGLDFTLENGRFCTSIHEWEAAEQTGAFKCARVVKTYGFDDRISFSEFVNHFYTERASAKLRSDKIHSLFYKFVLNSAYGKFAQNPENFAEFTITAFDDLLPEPWVPTYIHQGTYIIWSKPTDRKFYYNVCTGASITGAARAELLRGIHAAINPIYCDTDSVICESMRSKFIRLDNDALGSWKLEAVGNRAAICGKKLYTIIQSEHRCTCEKATKENPCARHIKKAHKGARLTGLEIERIAGGAVIRSENPVPSFKFTGQHQFTARNIRRTS